MNELDIAFGALCAWRENRGGGVPGMQSVINVLQNRANHRGTTIYIEVTRPLQFSSMTSNDPETRLYPSAYDAQFIDAMRLMQSAKDGTLHDLTDGALLYYAPHGLTPDEMADVDYVLPGGTKVEFPKSWDRTKVTFTAQIAKQLFFRET